MPITPRHDRRTEAFQQAEADHDFRAQELELRANTELTRQTQVLAVPAEVLARVETLGARMVEVAGADANGV